MKSNREKNKPSSGGRNLGVVLAVIACAVSIWYFSRSPVALDGDGYDLTVALYRVCNQRDTDGLNQIAGRLQEMNPPQSQQDALKDIVDDAQQGNWRAAMTACRSLLDDQVRR
ncbi:hypothetical protein Mal15_01890 [Stieleria maiorica]|uniref:Uncharacterized protein n=1 Tax=Stieleria maiorica TaxID=2795974 RepID=A0A5B9M571_9BACT|nr:hypothetical protein [Stieleria maiorica]QEF96162.1 hypothetical protein Mal15_01890 [Stieleria maiorica]